jgi:endonuclease YncB( thermonuclease family)
MRRPTATGGRAWPGPALAAVFLVMALGASACSPRPGLYADARSDAPAAAPRIEVLQGDVLVVDGRRVHLAETAVPQPAPSAHCIAEALAARQARLRLQQLAVGVRDVQVLPTGGDDAGGRVEAHVRFDSQDPAQTLVDEGLAVVSHGGPFSWCGPVSQALPQGQHIAMLSLSGS